jgi:chromosome segregation ATPase
VNEILNDKKELIDKIKEAENRIKELNNKNSALAKIYEEKIDDIKINHENEIEDFESQIKKIKYEKDQLQKKINEPMIKINKLLEEKSSLQNEIYKLKEKLQKTYREKDELENNIKNLEEEKNNLILEKENLISNMNHIDSRIKSKGPKNTDMSKRYQNIGQSSMTMIRTDMGLDKSARKKNQSNVSMDAGMVEDKNNNSLSGRKYNNISNANINNINSSGQKINHSFSGHKNGTTSSEKKLVCTSGLCDKDEGKKSNNDIKEEERKGENKTNKEK